MKKLFLFSVLLLALPLIFGSDGKSSSPSSQSTDKRPEVKDSKDNFDEMNKSTKNELYSSQYTPLYTPQN